MIFSGSLELVTSFVLSAWKVFVTCSLGGGRGGLAAWWGLKRKKPCWYFDAECFTVWERMFAFVLRDECACVCVWVCVCVCVRERGSEGEKERGKFSFQNGSSKQLIPLLFVRLFIFWDELIKRPPSYKSIIRSCPGNWESRLEMFRFQKRSNII